MSRIRKKATISRRFCISAEMVLCTVVMNPARRMESERMGKDGKKHKLVSKESKVKLQHMAGGRGRNIKKKLLLEYELTENVLTDNNSGSCNDSASVCACART